MTQNKWKIIGVSHYYPSNRHISSGETSQCVALDRVTFTQPYGQIVGIIGGKGAGKSTLAKVIADRISPSEGLISGRLERGRVLKLPDYRQEERSGESYVRYSLLKWGISKKKLSSLIETIHVFSELGTQFFQRVRTYSVEEKIQLEISLLLHVAPTMIYIDESLMTVKEDFYIKTFLFLRQLKELGSSIWIETGAVKRIESYCDQLVWLEFGKLQKHGETLEVLRHYDDYYFRIRRQSLMQQQRFWEEGYHSQLRSKELPDVQQVSHSLPILKKQRTISKPPDEPVMDSDQQSEKNVDQSLQVPLSRTQQRQQKPQQVYKWLLGGTALLGLTIGGAILTIKRPQGRIEGNISQPMYSSASQTQNQVAIPSESKMPPSFQSTSSSSSEGTHLVVEGDTLSLIADRYQVSVKELREWNHLSSDELEVGRVLSVQASIATTPSSSSYELAAFTHTVATGESLLVIAEQYGISIEELQKVNQLDGDLIYTGTVLSLPATAKPTEVVSSTQTASSVPPVILPETSGSYTVVKGDTLYSIAQKHGIDVMAIQQANHLQSDQLDPGTTLVIPSTN